LSPLTTITAAVALLLMFSVTDAFRSENCFIMPDSAVNHLYQF